MSPFNIKESDITGRVALFVAQKGWNKAEFARRVGIHSQDANKYLSGKLKPWGLFLPLFENGCDIVWLLAGVESGNEKLLLDALRRHGITAPEQLDGSYRRLRELEALKASRWRSLVLFQ